MNNSLSPTPLRRSGAMLLFSMKKLMSTFPLFFGEEIPKAIGMKDRWMRLVFALLPFVAPAQPSFQTCADKFDSKQYDSALLCIKQLAGDSVFSKEKYYDLGLCNYHLKNYNRAGRDFDTCLLIDSNFKEALWMQALTHEAQGNWKKAVTTYQLLNTRYGGYGDSKKRVFYYRLSVLISENWYYMLAIMFMIIIVVTVIAKTVTYKRG
jgi:tetratricopeptide (TPR) repeat protein